MIEGIRHRIEHVPNVRGRGCFTHLLPPSITYNHSMAHNAQTQGRNHKLALMPPTQSLINRPVAENYALRLRPL